MYLTMNRFRVREGQEAAFEEVWQSRDSHLKSVDGFESFHLLKGEAADGIRLYASHTAWRDRAAFEAWTRSEAFRAAHRGAGSHADMYDGPPVLEVFESVQSIA
ncbi:antibiotic biosynthesis monooxygenase family protein [Jannaschia seohaensis]|uniref:Heme-degrading monooxygenase HmoA n=1 Tax=Jannaschia seohaensis TaxID=475081 RepID=A0A2Y9A9N6_9RHOB|nr:antibiotic biosynthesis monooxygenase [Jannaschia seohaensis]PWJ20814.1 heme-degrading monooxygenase HmoA [Jannaschia seohaensis]SSA41224.1 Heme-degrading monooxygenase HmoA [Jannaschia seohaensis]